MVVYLAMGIKVEAASIEVIPIVRRTEDLPIVEGFIPVIDGVVFGMLRHHRRFTPDFRQYKRVAKIEVAQRNYRSATRRR